MRHLHHTYRYLSMPTTLNFISSIPISSTTLKRTVKTCSKQWKLKIQTTISTLPIKLNSSRQRNNLTFIISHLQAFTLCYASHCITIQHYLVTTQSYIIHSTSLINRGDDHTPTEVTPYVACLSPTTPRPSPYLNLKAFPLNRNSQTQTNPQIILDEYNIYNTLVLFFSILEYIRKIKQSYQNKIRYHTKTPLGVSRLQVGMVI